MRNTWILSKREFSSYFVTPIAYVFIVVFLLLNGLFTFYFGNFLDRGQADLVPFFNFHPWLYALFIPAITMRLWAEEHRSGSIELLFTLPITIWEAVWSKFLAAFLFTAMSLGLTFPLWLVVNYLGNPDNGVILASYIGSLFMAGGFLAIGACVSALTKNQVIAFVITVLLCLSINLLGFPVLTDYARNWLPGLVVDTLRNFSFLSNFDAIGRGLLDLRSVIYFASLIIFSLFANVIALETKKAD